MPAATAAAPPSRRVPPAAARGRAVPRRRAVLTCAAVLLAAAALAPRAATAQEAGTVLWRLDVTGFATMSQPAVAPDGTIYLHTNRLWAITPGGTVRWSKPLFDTNYIDIGPDGTVYAASEGTIYAFRPDGTLKWSFTEDPLGQGVMVGPTVGPDGNIYAVTDRAGLGALALTPDGELLWNVPGFGDRGGTGRGHVQFGPDNLYFAEDLMPQEDGCTELVIGLASVTLSGALDFCIAISGTSRTVATLDGRALLWQEGFSGKTLFAYTPSGTVDWTYTFDFSPTGIDALGVGPSGNVYLWHAAGTMASLTADGALRWEASKNIGLFPWRPVEAPDLATLVAGSPYGFGENGAILAADPATGATRWTIPVTGPSAGTGAPAAFSPDGSVAYVPVNTVSFDVADQLWAVQARDAAPAGLAVTAAPVDPPVVLPPGGGAFQVDVALENLAGVQATPDVWITITPPAGGDVVLGPKRLTLPPGADVQRRLTQQVPAGAPAGTYTYAVRAGVYPGTVEASDAFTFEKAAAAQQPATARAASSPAAQDRVWTLRGLDREAVQAAAPSAPTLEAPTLEAAYPNPFNPRTTLGYALPEAAQVRLSVHDVLGREVALLADGRQEAGRHRLSWDASALPSGVYLVRLVAGARTETRRVTLVR